MTLLWAVSLDGLPPGKFDAAESKLGWAFLLLEKNNTTDGLRPIAMWNDVSDAGQSQQHRTRQLFNFLG